MTTVLQYLIAFVALAVIYLIAPSDPVTFKLAGVICLAGKC